MRPDSNSETFAAFDLRAEGIRLHWLRLPGSLDRGEEETGDARCYLQAGSSRCYLQNSSAPMVHPRSFLPRGSLRRAGGDDRVRPWPCRMTTDNHDFTINRARPRHGSASPFGQSPVAEAGYNVFRRSSTRRDVGYWRGGTSSAWAGQSRPSLPGGWTGIGGR